MQNSLLKMKVLIGIFLTLIFITQCIAQDCPYTCLRDEECLFYNETYGNETYSGYSCECKSGLYSYPEYAPLLQASPSSCSPQQFNINIARCLGYSMIGSNFLLPDDDIQDNPCFNNTFSPEHGIATYVFTFGSANPNCTTAATVNGTHVTYSLDVLFKYNTTGLDIILYNSINVNFVCSYPLQMDANLDVGVIPVISTNTITVAGSGTYVTTMQLYKYSNYTGAYTVNDMPISLTVESPLYIGASVLGADPSKFACKVQSCYATPTQDSNDPVKYLIISEGCPIPGSTGVHFDIDGTELLIHFYIKLFKFTTSEKVYLHCTFDLCSGTCEPSCNTRTAETDNTLGSTQLDSGPFKLVGSGSAAGPSADFSWTLKMWTLLALLIMNNIIFK